MCTEFSQIDSMSSTAANSLGRKMRIPSHCPSTSKSSSPVTRKRQPPATANARMWSSSASRQTCRVIVLGTTDIVCRETYRTNFAAWRWENPNRSTSLSYTSRYTFSPATTSTCPRIRRHSERHAPFDVSTASQTLLSSSTRTTREGEGFFLGQLSLTWQTVKRGQQRVVIRFGEYPVEDARLLRWGELLKFVDELLRRHAARLTVSKKFSRH